jgi:hypothetical protein
MAVRFDVRHLVANKASSAGEKGEKLFSNGDGS